MTKKPRYFKDVNAEELMKAVVKMCKELGISGSSSGYDLYGAIAKEHEKAILHVKEQSEAFKDML